MTDVRHRAGGGRGGRQVPSYLVGLLATVGHLLDGHHLIGADVVGLIETRSEQEVNSNLRHKHPTADTDDTFFSASASLLSQ